MDLNEFTSIDGAQRSDNTFAADAGTQPAKPKRKRVKKTIDQQVAEAEERLKKLKAKQRNEERTKRNHRLIASAATIEPRPVTLSSTSALPHGSGGSRQRNCQQT
jgi:hypothetical protein